MSGSSSPVHHSPVAQRDRGLPDADDPATPAPLGGQAGGAAGAEEENGDERSPPDFLARLDDHVPLTEVCAFLARSDLLQLAQVSHLCLHSVFCAVSWRDFFAPRAVRLLWNDWGYLFRSISLQVGCWFRR